MVLGLKVQSIRAQDKNRGALSNENERTAYACLLHSSVRLEAQACLPEKSDISHRRQRR